MSLAVIFLCVFDTMFPVVAAIALSYMITREHKWDFAAYNALLSGCLIVLVNLQLGITVRPEWTATVEYAAIAFLLAFGTGLIAGRVQFEIWQKLRIELQIDDKQELIKSIKDY